MKIAIRFILVTMIALALSISLVSAQEEETLSASIVQAGSSLVIENVDDVFTLTLNGVALTTPIVSGDLFGAFPTGDLLSDWFATEISLPATLRFQLGNPDAEIYDFEITGTIIPASELVDPTTFEGTATYTFTADSINISEIVGTSPGSTTVTTLDKGDVFDDLFVNDVFTSGTDLYYVALSVIVDLEFIDALSDARIERLSGARPTSTGASCLPGFTCK